MYNRNFKTVFVFQIISLNSYICKTRNIIRYFYFGSRIKIFAYEEKTKKVKKKIYANL